MPAVLEINSFNPAVRVFPAARIANTNVERAQKFTRSHFVHPGMITMLRLADGKMAELRLSGSIDWPVMINIIKQLRKVFNGFQRHDAAGPPTSNAAIVRLINQFAAEHGHVLNTLPEPWCYSVHTSP